MKRRENIISSGASAFHWSRVLRGAAIMTMWYVSTVTHAAQTNYKLYRVAENIAPLAEQTYGGRYVFSLAQMNGHVYLFGGNRDSDGAALADVWRSDDMTSWTKICEQVPFSGVQGWTDADPNGSLFVAVNGNLRLSLGGLEEGYPGCLYSANGITWTTESSPTSPSAWIEYPSAVALGSKIKMFPSYFGFQSGDYWTGIGSLYESADGIDWTRLSNPGAGAPILASDGANLYWSRCGGEVLERLNVQKSPDGGTTWNDYATTQGEAMAYRNNHVSFWWDGHLFYGLGVRFDYPSDVWYFDQTESRWWQIDSGGIGGREEARTIVFNGKPYIVGGHGALVYSYADVWSVSTPTPTPIPTPTPTPIPTPTPTMVPLGRLVYLQRDGGGTSLSRRLIYLRRAAGTDEMDRLGRMIYLRRNDE